MHIKICRYMDALLSRCSRMFQMLALSCNQLLTGFIRRKARLSEVKAGRGGAPDKPGPGYIVSKTM